MAAKSTRIGLSWAIFLSFSAALLALLLVLFIVVPAQAEEYLTATLYERGKAVAKEIERKVWVTPRPYDEAGSAEIDQIVGEEPEIKFAGVFWCENACTAANRVASRRGEEPERLKDLLSEFNGRNRPVKMELDSGNELLISDQVLRTNTPGVGFVLISLDRGRIIEALTKLRRTLFVALLAGTFLFLVLVFLLSRQLIVRPLTEMMNMAAKLSEADLTVRVEGGNTREMDQLAEALNKIGLGLRETLSRVRGVSEGVAQVIDQISRTASTTTSGSSTVLTRVEETSSSMVEMLASLKGIAENVEVLFQSAEESSSSVMEMAATNDEVAENVTAMAASVEENTSQIEQMTFAIKEVNQSVEELLKTTEGTSNAMSEMDVAISQVETNAYETARLSEQVSKDAESGGESLLKTLHGIDKIKESSAQALQVIEQLGRRIGEIGNILSVIDDVAEQTNLLALNAAIIAAQAGEHGKGFAVVADEIKDLAERTGSSTREIGDLIRAVQQESRNAVAAMNQGVRNVDEGVTLGKEAENQLKKIQDSANKSTLMVKAIARATVEQARGSKEVTGSIARVAEAVEQISRATNEQARGADAVMKTVEKMKLLATHVQRSVQEQAHGSKQLTRSIENINEMAAHLNRAQREQSRGSEQVLKAIETIKTVSEAQNKSVKLLEEAIEALRSQADVLRGEVRRFRV
ncbi:MAG: methyl-accepting chemotaxis protein [Archangiaceae bacterium]|nr:methyl-accepting chemotaxis protein [Archangiaceae bacterium]